MKYDSLSEPQAAIATTYTLIPAHHIHTTRVPPCLHLAAQTCNQTKHLYCSTRGTNLGKSLSMAAQSICVDQLGFRDTAWLQLKHHRRLGGLSHTESECSVSCFVPSQLTWPAPHLKSALEQWSLNERPCLHSSGNYYYYAFFNCRRRRILLVCCTDSQGNADLELSPRAPHTHHQNVLKSSRRDHLQRRISCWII